jgi:hypothetical protein
MKLRYFLYLLLLFTPEIAHSQNRYIFFFTDKNNSSFTFSNPQQYLSARAIARRTAYSIPLDSTDLPVNNNYIQGVAATGAQILNVSKWFNAVIVETTSPTVLNAINQLPYVKGPGVVVGRPASDDPSVNKFRKELIAPQKEISASYLRNPSLNYGQAANQTSMISLEGLHNLGYSGQNMLIAVLDAGFMMADQMTCFDSLFQQNRVLYTWDFVDRESDVYNDNNHGSSVLSCMAANVPGDMVGTAPHASYLLLRSEDAGSEYIIEEYNWSVAAEFADSAGADVINSSLGYYTFDDPSQNHTYADMDGNTCPAAIAADLAASKGILVTASAGNEGSSSWNYIITPSDGDSVMAVGAVDPFSVYANFSSNGPASDGRVKPDVAAQGQQTTLYSPWSGNTPVQGNGTSFSGPIIAGAAACLWQSSPQHNSQDIIQAIRQSASQFTSPDTNLGYGIPNFSFASNLLGLGDITIPANAGLHLFPNPSVKGNEMHLLYLSKGNQPLELNVYDASGRKIFSQTYQSAGYGYTDIRFNPDLQSGVYLVEISGQEGSRTGRFIRY